MLGPPPKPFPARAVNNSMRNGTSAAIVAGTSTSTTTTTRPRLTLSAFRRPGSVRLTQSDPSRRVEVDYDLTSQGCGILGHGAFSTVRLAQRRQDGTKVAIKSIAKHEALRARRLRRSAHCGHVVDEWEILRQMKGHPYIIGLLDTFETDDKIHLVTEYCQGGELFDAIQQQKRTSPNSSGRCEAQAAHIMRQMLTALKDLHASGIMHRDVKPENILLINNDGGEIHAKLCDFGMARFFDRSNNCVPETPPSTPGRRHSFCAVSCDYYAAPEVCRVGSAQRPSADVYSLGVTLYILLSGFPPPPADDKELFPPLRWNHVSSCAKDLIRSMLHPDPSQRITAESALQNKWILQHSNPNSHGVTFHPRQTNNKNHHMQAPTTVHTATAANLRLPAPPPAPSLKVANLSADQVRNQLYQALTHLSSQNKDSAASAVAATAAAKKKKRSSLNNSAAIIVSPKRKRRRGSMEKCCAAIAVPRLGCGSATTLQQQPRRPLPPRRGSMLTVMMEKGAAQRRSSILCDLKQLYCDGTSSGPPQQPPQPPPQPPLRCDSLQN